MNPFFSEPSYPAAERIEQDPDPPVLIKKQSKDEATEPLSTIEERAAKVSVEPLDILEALNTLVKSFVPAKSSSRFDPDAFRDRLFLDNEYAVNRTWMVDHSVMACPARHFLERFSVQGEFFEKYD
jgi:hypothetical protein